jgi:hypothetical protein
VIGGLCSAGLLGASLHPRLSAVERRVDVLERIALYEGCRSWMEDHDRDPAECGVIFKDLGDFFSVARAPQVKS